MTDYVNHQFKYFIPEKDAEENLLLLQPVPENVRGVKKLDDFVKYDDLIMGQSAQVLNQDATMEKFQQKILDVQGPFLDCGKGWRISQMPQMILPQCLLKITLS